MLARILRPLRINRGKSPVDFGGLATTPVRLLPSSRSQFSLVFHAEDFGRVNWPICHCHWTAAKRRCNCNNERPRGCREVLEGGPGYVGKNTLHISQVSALFPAPSRPLLFSPRRKRAERLNRVWPASRTWAKLPEASPARPQLSWNYVCFIRHRRMRCIRAARLAVNRLSSFFLPISPLDPLPYSFPSSLPRPLSLRFPLTGPIFRPQSRLFRAFSAAVIPRRWPSRRSPKGLSLKHAALFLSRRKEFFLMNTAVQPPTRRNFDLGTLRGTASEESLKSMFPRRSEQQSHPTSKRTLSSLCLPSTSDNSKLLDCGISWSINCCFWYCVEWLQKFSAGRVSAALRSILLCHRGLDYFCK